MIQTPWLSVSYVFYHRSCPARAAARGDRAAVAYD